jgi:hypothetical protein
MALVARCRFDWANAIDSGVSRLIRLQTAGFPGKRSRLATFTWVVTPSAQLTVASSRELPGLNGAMAVKVPRANGPTLVGAAGPLSIASDCRKLLEKRTVLPSL